MNMNHSPDKGQLTSGGGGGNPQTSNETSDSRRTAQSPLESALRYTGRGAETVPGHDAPPSERAQRIATERGRLQEWAAKEGRLGPLPSWDIQGNEHNVAFGPSQARVIKSTRMDN